MDDQLKERASLSIDLLPETDEDRKTARLLHGYRTLKSKLPCLYCSTGGNHFFIAAFDEMQKEKRDQISNRALFESPIPEPSSSRPSGSSSTTGDKTPAAKPALKRLLAEDIALQKTKRLSSGTFDVASAIVRKKKPAEKDEPIDPAPVHANGTSLVAAYGSDESDDSD